jgi:hypothetical protein
MNFDEKYFAEIQKALKTQNTYFSPAPYIGVIVDEGILIRNWPTERGIGDVLLQPNEYPQELYNMHTIDDKVVRWVGKYKRKIKIENIQPVYDQRSIHSKKFMGIKVKAEGKEFYIPRQKNLCEEKKKVKIKIKNGYRSISFVGSKRWDEL